MKIDPKELQAFVESAEHLLSERTELNAQINSIFADLQEKGYDARVIRQLIRMRKFRQEELLQHCDLLNAYVDALGMR